MAYTKVTGALVGSLSDLDLTNVGDIQLDSITGDGDTNTSITFSGSDVITIATGGTTALTVDANQKLTANSGVAIDNITIDGTEIDLSSGDLTLDVAGDIILDADGGDVKVSDGGTHIGTFTNSSSDFVITSAVQDNDIILKGDDGGSVITALTLDMSDAGSAHFNSRVGIGVAAHATAGLNITNTSQHIRLNNSSELGVITLDSDGNLDLWAHGADETITFRNGTSTGTVLATIGSHGLGVGVTPEGAYNGYTSIEFGQQGAIFANDAADDFGLKVNTYLDSGGNWKRKETGVASALDMDGDQIKIFTAASGSADANITFAQKFRLDNDGLKFGTDTAAANALNDYEEGTWTPNIVGTTGSAGTHAQSSSGAGNNYTKIGNRVYFQMSRYVTNKGSYSGKTKVTGLPFTNNGSTAAITMSLFPDGDYPDTRMVLAQITTNSEIQFYDGARADVQHDWADLGTGYYLNCAGTYLTDS